MESKNSMGGLDEVNPSEATTLTADTKSKIKNLASTLILTGTIAATQIDSARAEWFWSFESFDDVPFWDNISLDLEDESPKMLSERVKKLCFFYSLCKADEVEKVSLQVFWYLQAMALNNNYSPFLEMSEEKQLSILKEVMK